mmetsp:Transcript_86425/g.201041  ORF Transcript_86425/g.201041 Transcript_86425/m.201041 type:complete len:215 (-) Transcript_86425:837-1481(-)
MAALHACIQHAAVGHSVCLKTLAAHLGPSLQDFLNVASSPVGLHDGAVCDRRTTDAILTHPLQSCLQPRHVTHPAEDVKERVHQHLVNILRLCLEEVLDKGHPARRAPFVTTIRNAFCEDRHRVLVCPQTATLHLLKHVPRFFKVCWPCTCRCVHKQIQRSLVGRHPQPWHFLADDETGLFQCAARQETTEHSIEGCRTDEACLCAPFHVSKKL